MSVTYTYNGKTKVFVPGVGVVEPGGEIETETVINNQKFQEKVPVTQKEIRRKMKRITNSKK